jgi:ribosomal RNA-processing protein 17
MAPHASKKRKLAASNAPAELIFDNTSRTEYLTGFHKRKQARIKHAQEVAAKKEREEKVRQRALVCYKLLLQFAKEVD